MAKRDDDHHKRKISSNPKRKLKTPQIIIPTLIY